MSGYGVAWERQLSTYGGIVAGASHWMVRLAGKVEDVEVSYLMDADDAKALSSYDFTERAGTQTSRFRSEEAAKAAAAAAFRHLAGPRDVLVDKYDHGVLAGPADLIAEGDALVVSEEEQEAGKDGGWWDWKRRFEAHLHPTRYGYKAPPSPRHDVEVTVQRVGEEWRVVRVD